MSKAKLEKLNAASGQIVMFKDLKSGEVRRFKLGSMAEIGDVICYSALMLEGEDTPMVIVQRDEGFYLDNVDRLEKIAGSGS